jgi:hypothetical protein
MQDYQLEWDLIVMEKACSVDIFLMLLQVGHIYQINEKLAVLCEKE